MAQLSISGRRNFLYAVSQGRIFWALPGDATWTEATYDMALGTPPLIYTGIMQSCQALQRGYFADGSNRVYFNSVDQKAYPWVATKGSLPVGSDGGKPRLTCNWRGRVLQSGLITDPQTIFAPRIDDPSDYEFFPAAPDKTQAWAATTGQEGLIGDEVMTMWPYNDDVLLVFGTKSITRFSGDPADGGTKDIISKAIGGTWMDCACEDALGNVYFSSQHLGIYVIPPGGYPQWISAAIDRDLKRINTGESIILNRWDNARREYHLFVTIASAPDVTKHFTWEQRTGAWNFDEHANTNHNPLTATQWDGNTTDDRKLVMGGWDGYVRFFDEAAVDDDGTPIESYVVIGPILSKTFEEMRLGDLLADLGETSGSVTYDIFTGTTAEAALSSASVASGTLVPGRSTSQPIRVAGHAVYVRLSSNNRWSMDRIIATLRPTGMIRARSR